MYAQVIEDQYDLSLLAMREPRQKTNEYPGIQRAEKDLPAHLPFVGYRGDDAQALAVDVGAHHGRLSSGSVAAPAHIVRAQAGFVAPLNLGIFCFRVFGDLGIGFVEPLTDCHGRLLISFLERALRGKSPTLQIFAGVAHGQADAEMRFDQFTDRLAGPQRKAHLQLVGRVVLDQALNLALLLGAKQSTTAFGPAGTLDLHCCPASVPKCLVRLHNRVRGSLELTRRFPN